jgi:hypothetical protein
MMGVNQEMGCEDRRGFFGYGVKNLDRWVVDQIDVPQALAGRFARQTEVCRTFDCKLTPAGEFLNWEGAVYNPLPVASWLSG